LKDRFFYRSRDTDTGYTKSSVHKVLLHVFCTIVDGLDEHLSDPDENCRHELAALFPGILSGFIGVGDVKE
jgi:hypothetical protein